MAHLDSETGDDTEVMASINIIPFVDIALVLLIIFMVTSQAIARQSLQVDLPRAASGGSTPETTLNIVLTQEQALLLNGEPVDRDSLARITRDQAATNPKLQAVIAADQANPYGDVVAVIDLVKTNGVTSFALNIERTRD